MPPSRVIRIDDQVWSELQKLARPLEDTPNSVLRRVFGLPEETPGDDAMDSRVSRLLELFEERLGETPQVCRMKKTYSVLSKAQEAVAYVRPQYEKLRIGAGRDTAQRAGLSGWDRERKDGFFGGPSVRWYIPDGDQNSYERAAEVLERLWRLDPQQ